MMADVDLTPSHVLLSARCPDDPDMWRLTPGKTISPPSIVRVLVRTDEVAAQTAPPPEASRGSAAGGAADRYPGASGHCQLDTPPLRHRRATFPATSTSDCEVEQRPVPGGSPARPPAGLNAPRRHATGRAAAPATSTDASSASARPEPAPVSRQRRPAEACDPGMNTMGASRCVQPRPAVRRRTRFPSAEARPESCAGDAAELCWGAKARRSSCAARSPPRDYKKAPSGRSTLCDDGGALASLAVRIIVLGRPGRVLPADQSTRLYSAGLLGYLPIFIPVAVPTCCSSLLPKTQ